MEDFDSQPNLIRITGTRVVQFARRASARWSELLLRWCNLIWFIAVHNAHVLCVCFGRDPFVMRTKRTLSTNASDSKVAVEVCSRNRRNIRRLGQCLASHWQLMATSARCEWLAGDNCANQPHVHDGTYGNAGNKTF